MTESSGNQEGSESFWGICHAEGEPKNVKELVQTWLEGTQIPADPGGLHHDALRLPPYLLLSPPQGSDVAGEQVKACPSLILSLIWSMIEAKLCTEVALLVQNLRQCTSIPSGLPPRTRCTVTGRFLVCTRNYGIWRPAAIPSTSSNLVQADTCPSMPLLLHFEK